MRWLRSTLRLRAVTLLLVVGLLPAVVVWPKQATMRWAVPHADTLRAQVGATLDDTAREAFEAALRAASDAEARSMEGFLRRFAEAYVQRGVGPSLAQLFGLSEGRDAHVMKVLQRRLAQAVGWAMVPLQPVFQQDATFHLVHPPIGDAARIPASSAFTAFQTGVAGWSSAFVGVSLVHAVSSLRPRAP